LNFLRVVFCVCLPSQNSVFTCAGMHRQLSRRQERAHSQVFPIPTDHTASMQVTCSLTT
jgi:hypothetical protein